jgi:hypothetical protein
MPQVKPINRILDIDAYKNDRKIIFQVNDSLQPQEGANNMVEIPISIAFRIYYLGRAYDFQTIKLIYPSGRSRINYIHLPLLTLELEQIFEIVNDPIVRCYLGFLLPLLKNIRTNTKSELIIIEK